MFVVEELRNRQNYWQDRNARVDGSPVESKMPARELRLWYVFTWLPLLVDSYIVFNALSLTAFLSIFVSRLQFKARWGS